MLLDDIPATLVITYVALQDWIYSAHSQIDLVGVRYLLMTLALKCFQRLRLFYSQRDGSLMLSTFRSSCTFTLSIRTPEVIR